MSQNHKRNALINFIADHSFSTKEMQEVTSKIIDPILESVAMHRHAAGYGRLGAEPYVVRLFDIYAAELESLVADGSCVLMYRTDYDNPWRLKVLAVDQAESVRANIESFNQWATTIVIEPAMVQQARAARDAMPKHNNPDGIEEHILKQYEIALSVQRGISAIKKVELLVGPWGKVTLIEERNQVCVYYMDTWSGELPELRHARTILTPMRTAMAPGLAILFRETLAKDGVKAAISDFKHYVVYRKDDPSDLTTSGWKVVQ